MDPRNTATRNPSDFAECMSDDPHGEFDANRQLAETARKTVNIPANIDADDVWLAFNAYSNHHATENRPMLSRKYAEMAYEIDMANADTTGVVPELTDVGAPCDCDGRDADEIPLYLHRDELKAVHYAMEGVTFGGLNDAVSVLSQLSASKEVKATLRRTID